MRRLLIALAALTALAGPAWAEADHDYQEPSSSHDFGYSGQAPRGHGGWGRRDAYAYGYDPYASRSSYGYGYAYDGERRGYRDYGDRAYSGGMVREGDMFAWLRRLDRRLRAAQDRWRP
jgi:hypothetical protein